MVGSLSFISILGLQRAFWNIWSYFIPGELKLVGIRTASLTFSSRECVGSIKNTYSRLPQMVAHVPHVALQSLTKIKKIKGHFGIFGTMWHFDSFNWGPLTYSFWEMLYVKLIFHLTCLLHSFEEVFKHWNGQVAHVANVPGNIKYVCDQV